MAASQLQKKGLDVGKTKRGKGTKIMAITDADGVPIAVDIRSASPHETKLVNSTLSARFLPDGAQRLVGDKAYDSDPLDAELAEQGIEMIAPHRRNQKKARTQDGRKLRRYRRRWKVERFFAWLGNFRRVVVRYEYRSENYLAFVQLACIVILLRQF